MNKIQQPSPFTKGKKKKSESALSSPGRIKEFEDMYMGMDLSQNPYADMENPYVQATNQYAGMTNPYANLGNAYEGMGNVYSGMTNQFEGMENVFEGAQNNWADMKSQFEGMENEFANIDNQYANLKNQYSGMENRMEEIGISTEAADFAAEQQAQSRADIMSALSGAAGGSGISGLAQTLANQASQDARASSADIAKQEVENEKMRLQEGSRIDMLQRGEASKLDMARAGEQARIEQMKAQGATDIDKMIRQERGEIDRTQRSAEERMQDRELQEKARLGTLTAQEASRLDQLERGYEGDMDKLIRGEESRLDLLDAQGAYDLERLQRGEDARLQDQFLSTDFDMQKLEREGSMYTQQLEMDRISTLLQGALGAGAAKAQAGATKKAGKSSGISAIAGAAISTKTTFICVPKGVEIDLKDGKKPIEKIKVGDIIIGYSGEPVKVLQKHEYLEDPKVERFYKVKFKNPETKEIHEVNVCDMHRIMGERAMDITENVVGKEIHAGVNYSYDLLTEDAGYKIDGVPVNSMIEELALAISEKIKNN